MEGSGQKQADYTQTEQTGTHLGDSAVIDLFLEAKTTSKECHAHNQEKVCQDGAKQRSLDDTDLILDQGNDEDDQLHGVSESDVDESSNCVTQTTGDTLGGVTEKSSERNDGHCIHREDDGWVETCSLAGNTHWYKDQKDIDPAVADGIFGVVRETDGSVSHAARKARLCVGFRDGPWGRVLHGDIHLSILRRFFGRIRVGGLLGGSLFCQAARRGVSFRPRVNPVYGYEQGWSCAAEI